MPDEFQYPKEIAEQADMAEALHAQLFPVTPDTPPEPDPVIEEPVVEPVDESFKTKYETLKGKYDAEVPRLAQELREFKETYINNQLAQLKQQEPQPEPEPENPVLAAMRAEYGDEFIEQLSTLIQLQTKPLVQEYTKPLVEQAHSLEEIQTTLARADFEKHLDTTAKGWREAYESDPKFGEFLTQPDPTGLYTYGDLLKVYSENWDKQKMSTLFNLYLNQNKVPEVAPQQNPAREALVAPSRTPSNPTPNVNDAKIWSIAEVEEFKRNDREGKYSTEDSKLLWDDLLQAASQNRIR